MLRTKLSVRYERTTASYLTGVVSLSLLHPSKRKSGSSPSSTGNTSLTLRPPSTHKNKGGGNDITRGHNNKNPPESYPPASVEAEKD